MVQFVSKRKLFQLDLPENWHHDWKDNVYTFYEGDSDADSVLQVSVMAHPEGKQFVLQQELEKEQKVHPTSQITELSEYGAVHYGLDMADEKMLQYRWVTGYKNVKLFCALTISSGLENQKIDEDYEKAVEILDTLKIFSPEK